MRATCMEMVEAPDHHLPVPQVRPHRPRERQRIDPGMAVEPLVLRGHQGPPHLRRQLREPDRHPPPLVRGKEEPQRLPLVVRHHDSGRTGEMKLEQWRVLAQARAIENECYVGAVSQTPPISIGRSVFVNPMGRIVGQLDEEPALGIFDTHLTEVAATRDGTPRWCIAGTP